MFVDIDICRLRVTYVQQKQTQNFVKYFLDSELISAYTGLFTIFFHIKDIATSEKHLTQLLENTILYMGRIQKLNKNYFF
jgi:hypothetical protein